MKTLRYMYTWIHIYIYIYLYIYISIYIYTHTNMNSMAVMYLCKCRCLGHSLIHYRLLWSTLAFPLLYSPLGLVATHYTLHHFSSSPFRILFSRVSSEVYISITVPYFPCLTVLGRDFLCVWGVTVECGRQVVCVGRCTLNWRETRGLCGPVIIWSLTGLVANWATFEWVLQYLKVSWRVTRCGVIGR